MPRAELSNMQTKCLFPVFDRLSAFASYPNFPYLLSIDKIDLQILSKESYFWTFFPGDRGVSIS